MLYFSVCGLRYGIVDFCAICFRVLNALWYCGIPCKIFSACVTCSGVVEFCVIYFACGTRSGIL